MIARLHYISQEPHLANILEACEAGCDWIQLRAKNLSETEYLILAKETKQITDRFHAKLIINDSLETALKVGAYGVHLGKKDLDLAEARKLAGPNLVIGGSTNSLQDILEAVAKGVNYLGLGPYRFTTTKTDLNPVLGLDGMAVIMKELRRLQIKLPIIAIGGIQSEDILALRKLGIYGIAVSGVISQAKEKRQLVQDMHNQLG